MNGNSLNINEEKLEKQLKVFEQTVKDSAKDKNILEEPFKANDQL